jgi:diguanylate cyclase (GGDEF)-like protein
MRSESDPPVWRKREAAVPAHEALVEQLRLLRAHLPRALFTYLTATGLAVLALAATAPPGLLAGWWLVGAVVAGARYRAARRYLIAIGPDASPERALTRFRADSAALGLVLGAAAVLTPYSDVVGQGILLILLMGALGGAMPALAGDLRSFRYFAVAAVLPIVGMLLWSASRAEPRTGWIAALAVLYLFFMLATARRIHRTLSEALNLRFEKAALADELRDSNVRLQEDIALRQRSESRLQVRVEFERVISELSSDFVRLPVEEIDEGIQRALQSIGEFSGVDRAYVFLQREDATVDNTHEWCAEGVSAEIGNLQGLQPQQFPWLTERLLAGQDVHVPRVADLPPEAAAERAEWEREGVRSLVAVPMILAGAVRGFLGFDAVREEKQWTSDDIALLRLAGETFVNAIERRHTEGLIHRQARYDDLTGLPNRRLFMEHLSRSIALGRRQSLHGAVLFVDLDRFKPINDSLGHSAGDVLLRETSRRLFTRLREYDVAARLGGDEFAVLLPQLAPDPEKAESLAGAVAEKIRLAIAAPLNVDRHELRVTASIGIAFFPRDADGAEQVLESADVAMYQAKAAGRDAVRFFAPAMKASTVNRLRQHSELRGAASRGELELFLQPQMDGNRRIVGAEGLLRWRHPERGLLCADQFVPLAEDTGLIPEMDEWALRTACRYLRDRRGLLVTTRDFRIALNVSPATFRDADFVRRTAGIIQAHQVPAGMLEFEVTERLFLMEHDGATEKLAALQDVGIRVSIDDFGTGYSSLAYLKHLPINRIKVDKAFVQGVHGNRNDAAIVEAIMGMAASFGYEVIAEGVENEADFDFLRLVGIWLFQGHLFGRPLPAEEFLKLLAPAPERLTGAIG